MGFWADPRSFPRFSSSVFSVFFVLCRPRKTACGQVCIIPGATRPGDDNQFEPETLELKSGTPLLSRNISATVTKMWLTTGSLIKQYRTYFLQEIQNVHSPDMSPIQSPTRRGGARAFFALADAKQKRSREREEKRDQQSESVERERKTAQNWAFSYFYSTKQEIDSIAQSHSAGGKQGSLMRCVLYI